MKQQLKTNNSKISFKRKIDYKLHFYYIHLGDFKYRKYLKYVLFIFNKDRHS